MSVDRLGRPLRDLRISVTDRCNFRCVYCMPKEIFGSAFAGYVHRDDLLTFEEIARVAALFVQAGAEKIRLTGGEPLLRRDLERLVEMLARVRGLADLTLTTNGSLLTREKARALRGAGLTRVTVSLDSLDDAVFRRMNDADFPVATVLEAIDWCGKHWDVVMADHAAEERLIEAHGMNRPEYKKDPRRYYKSLSAEERNRLDDETLPR